MTNRVIHIGPEQRRRLSFRAVNRAGQSGYDAALQRHHVLPRAILGRSCFRAMLDGLGHGSVDLDDFRRNGLLLPCRDGAAIRLGLPLHRGPHLIYNDMVMERFGQIERTWQQSRHTTPIHADQGATMRIGLLQGALRRRLLSPSAKRLRLNRFDPFRGVQRFADLDAMADLLWRSSETLGDAPN